MAGKFQPPPIQGQKFIDDQGLPTEPLRKWLELIPPALTSPANSGSVPKNIASQGVTGQMATDGTYLYVCTGANQWRRALLSVF